MSASEETQQNMPASEETKKDIPASQRPENFKDTFFNKPQEGLKDLLWHAAEGRNREVRNYIWKLFLQLEEAKTRMTLDRRIEKREYIIKKWREANEEDDYFNCDLRNTLIDEAEKYRCEDLFPDWLVAFEEVCAKRRLSWTLGAEKVRMALVYAIGKSKDKTEFSYEDPLTW